MYARTEVTQIKALCQIIYPVDLESCYKVKRGNLFSFHFKMLKKYWAYTKNRSQVSKFKT